MALPKLNTAQYELEVPSTESYGRVPEHSVRTIRIRVLIKAHFLPEKATIFRFLDFL